MIILISIITGGCGLWFLDRLIFTKSDYKVLQEDTPERE